MIKTTYLEMNSPEKLRCPIRVPSRVEQLHLARTTCPAACAAMFSTVGRPFYWEIDRFGWTRNQWAAHLSSQDVAAFFFAIGQDEKIGYVETKKHSDAKVEIVYFGLAPEYVGKNLGGHALSLIVKKVFENGCPAVWLHTCSLDHVAALGNYYSRGFEFVKEEHTDWSLPEQTPVFDTAQQSPLLLDDRIAQN
jgi:ribosomal protein S18 acetylase RimI-like enzyme